MMGDLALCPASTQSQPIKDLRSCGDRGRGLGPVPECSGVSQSRVADADIVASLEAATPGSAVDRRLRREQAQAVLDLLAASCGR